MSENLERRSFIIGTAAVCLSTGVALLASGCDPITPPGDCNPEEPLPPLPPSSPDPDDPFGIDLNINMGTIDSYLNRSDVVYRDLRMLVGLTGDEGIESSFSVDDMLNGFRIVPFPYLAKLPNNAMEGSFSGETLISIEYDANENIVSHRFLYEESLLVLTDLFPKDKAIFLVCKLGDHAGLLRKLLIRLGWDAKSIYNVGGMWAYTGTKIQEILVYPSQAGGNKMYATWRADYATIDFSLLHQAKP